MTPTSEQQAIFEASGKLRPGSSMKVIAYAGTGKSSTLKGVARLSFPRERGVNIQFNRANAEEARSSFPANVDSVTMNSLAWRAVGMRPDDIAKSFRPEDIERLLDLANAGKAGGRGLLVRSVMRGLASFMMSAEAEVGMMLAAEAYWMSCFPGGVFTKEQMHRALHDPLTPMVRDQIEHVWRQIRNFRANGIRIPHDAYLKIFERSPDLIARSFSRYGFILLDEAQDLNPVMRSIALQAMRAGQGRKLIAVGDPWQQIYGWRGAENALDHIPGPVFHLSQSFRFGDRIADNAWQVLTSKPVDAPTVRLRGNGREASIQIGPMEGNGAILCRSNSGALEAAAEMASAGRRFHVVGGLKDLALEVNSAFALMKGDIHRVRSDTLKGYGSWNQFCDAAESSGDQALMRLIQMVGNGNAMKRLRQAEAAHVDEETAADIIISTAHRAKGREWDYVHIWRDFPSIDELNRNYQAARQQGSREAVRAALEEWHVLYVADTRARLRMTRQPTIAGTAQKMRRELAGSRSAGGGRAAQGPGPAGRPLEAGRAVPGHMAGQAPDGRTPDQRAPVQRPPGHRRPLSKDPIYSMFRKQS